MLTTATNPKTLLIASFAAGTALLAAAALILSLLPTANLDRPGRGVVDLIAEPDAGCENPNDPQCHIGDGEEDETDPDQPGGGDGGGGGGPCTFNNGDGTIEVSDQRSRPVIVLVAQWGEVVVPCQIDGWGWYNQSDGCYYGDFPAVREATNGIPEPPEGKTEEDGRYYYLRCLQHVYGELPNQTYLIFAVEQWAWVDYADVPTVTPLQVAQDWLATVNLSGVEFQLAPPTTGAGLVHLPVWLAVDQTADSWGEISQDHCIAGVCVSITAKVTSVDWNLGDGTTITCTRDQHEVWDTEDFLSPGEHCHHYYRQAGDYQITATSNWTVEWVSEVSDAAGELTTTAQATVAYEINEIQVLTGS